MVAEASTILDIIPAFYRSQKKLLASSCSNQVLVPWIQGIINHLYWVAAIGQGDEELAVSIWRGSFNHVCDEHDSHDGPYNKCLNDHLEGREWMRSSREYRCHYCCKRHRHSSIAA